MSNRHPWNELLFEYDSVPAFLSGLNTIALALLNTKRYRRDRDFEIMVLEVSQSTGATLTTRLLGWHWRKYLHSCSTTARGTSSRRLLRTSGLWLVRMVQRDRACILHPLSSRSFRCLTITLVHIRIFPAALCHHIVAMFVCNEVNKQVTSPCASAYIPNTGTGVPPLPSLSNTRLCSQYNHSDEVAVSNDWPARVLSTYSSSRQ